MDAEGLNERVAGGRTRSVLVVDDEPMIRQIVADCLVEAGYRARTATNGSDALRVMQHSTPDLIVLDLMMPVLDATGFLKQVRLTPRYARVPVLVMTATYGAYEQAARLGVQACLTKPFEFDDLVAEVDRLLGRRRARASSRADVTREPNVLIDA
jgi:DNA-binding response OmpR family regulator